MSEQTYTTSSTPHLTIDACGGDLTIEGTSESEVTFDFEQAGSQIQREGETFRATFGSDARITCPANSSITIKRIGGDFSASDLSGTLAVESVGADVSLRGAGVVTLQSVGADVSARDLTGDLRIGSVGGDLEVRRIDGQLIVENVGGDLGARALNGGADIKAVGGDASIETDIAAGKTYRIKAGGDLTLRLPTESSACFTLAAGGEIESRVMFSEWSGDPHAGKGTLGSGEAQVELSAGGDLTLLPQRGEIEFEFNLGAIGTQIDAKMELFEHEMEAKLSELSAQITRVAAQGTRQLDERLRHIDIEGISRRAERAAERVRQRAREAAERARAQAERAAERARRRAERARKHGHGHGVRFNVDLTSPGSSSKPGRATPAAGATDEERRVILRMLEEKKITAEEASRLLQALEG
ncbi:MAG TPA: hypothetical protein VIK33_08015 [Anaerolineae bacterium]